MGVEWSLVSHAWRRGFWHSCLSKDALLPDRSRGEEIRGHGLKERRQGVKTQPAWVPCGYWSPSVVEIDFRNVSVNSNRALSLGQMLSESLWAQNPVNLILTEFWGKISHVNIAEIPCVLQPTSDVLEWSTMVSLSYRYALQTGHLPIHGVLTRWNMATLTAMDGLFRPLKFTGWNPNPPWDAVRRWGLWEVLKLWDWNTHED